MKVVQDKAVTFDNFEDSKLQKNLKLQNELQTQGVLRCLRSFEIVNLTKLTLKLEVNFKGTLKHLEFEVNFKALNYFEAPNLRNYQK